jgi:hypothetical protein
LTRNITFAIVHPLISFKHFSVRGSVIGPGPF